MSAEDIAKCREECVSGTYTCLAGKHPKLGPRLSTSFKRKKRTETILV